MQERTPRQFVGQFAGIPGASGNIAGQAMAEAAARIFEAREQTIRETIDMYRKLLYDLLGKEDTN